jgi:hypothetical protein
MDSLRPSHLFALDRYLGAAQSSSKHEESVVSLEALLPSADACLRLWRHAGACLGYKDCNWPQARIVNIRHSHAVVRRLLRKIGRNVKELFLEGVKIKDGSWRPLVGLLRQLLAKPDTSHDGRKVHLAPREEKCPRLRTPSGTELTKRNVTTVFCTILMIMSWAKLTRTLRNRRTYDSEDDPVEGAADRN